MAMEIEWKDEKSFIRVLYSAGQVPTRNTLEWRFISTRWVLYTKEYKVKSCKQRRRRPYMAGSVQTLQSARSASSGTLRGSEISCSAHSLHFETTKSTWRISSFEAEESFQPRLQRCYTFVSLLSELGFAHAMGFTMTARLKWELIQACQCHEGRICRN